MGVFDCMFPPSEEKKMTKKKKGSASAAGPGTTAAGGGSQTARDGGGGGGGGTATASSSAPSPAAAGPPHSPKTPSRFFSTRQTFSTFEIGNDDDDDVDGGGGGVTVKSETPELPSFATTFSRRFTKDGMTAADMTRYQKAKSKAGAMLINLRSGITAFGEEGEGAHAETDDEATMNAAAAQVDAKKKSTMDSGREAVDSMKDGGLPQQYWTCPGASNFKIRGRTYLTDRKKIDAHPPAFDLARVDLIHPGKEWAPHVASRLNVNWGPPGTLSVFIVVVMFPGPNAEFEKLQLVCYFTPTSKTASILGAADDGDDGDSLSNSSPFASLLATFLAADAKTKSDIFKMIPGIADGPWVAKKSVGNTPVIIGRKLKTSYHIGPGYLEVDIDVASNSTARNITGFCVGMITRLQVDLGFLFEGHSEDELPEELLGTVRIINLPINAETVTKLDDFID